MKKSTLYAIWGVFYSICAGMGFIPEPHGAVRVGMVVISLLFFVPPAVLLYHARKDGDNKTRRMIRNLAALSLVLTLVLLIVNILTAFSAQWVANTAHVLLVLCSAPMFCSTYWVAPLFLWAVLLFAAMQRHQGK